MTRLGIVQHHPLETPGYILSWAQARDMSVFVQKAWTSAAFPNPDDFDAVVLLGGPYGVADVSTLPWLAEEVDWLQHCLDAGMPTFAICLGAQLLALCLGAKVEPMAANAASPIAELGWVQAKFCADLAALGSRPVLQWHEDTFHTPAGAQRLAHSVIGNFNQGFQLAGRGLIGVQFHPEWSASTYARLIDCLADAETAVVLRAALSQTALFEQQQALCAALLDFWLPPTAHSDPLPR